MCDLDTQSCLAPMLTMYACRCRQVPSTMNDAGPSEATCKHRSMCRQGLQAVLGGALPVKTAQPKATAISLRVVAWKAARLGSMDA